MSKSNTVLLAAGVLVGIGVGVLLLFAFRANRDWNPANGIENSQKPAVPEIGSPAPGFELVSLDGEMVNLDDFAGQPVIVNFWATWCGPCRLEMPIFQEYHDRFANNLTILAVNVGESEAVATAFVDEMEIEFSVLLDQQGVVENLYQVRGLPSTYFIDRDGEIRFLHLGVITEKQLDGYLAELGVVE